MMQAGYECVVAGVEARGRGGRRVSEFLLSGLGLLMRCFEVLGEVM